MNIKESYPTQADECNFPVINPSEALEELKTINEIEPITAQDIQDDLVEAIINLEL